MGKRMTVLDRGEGKRSVLLEFAILFLHDVLLAFLSYDLVSVLSKGRTVSAVR